MKSARLVPSLFIIFILAFVSVVPAKGQALIGSGSGTNLFDRFQDEQFQEKTDQEVMQEEFKKKRSAYESLLTRETPVFFQADKQEIDEKTRIFTLSGNVEIWKDVFKLKADWVQIHQWTGKIDAKGNVVLYFQEDILTGDRAEYNFNTGTGWLTNARASVEPQLFLEAETLVKLPDTESNGQGQYAIYDGMITACGSETPAWRFDTGYAVIRLENYAHMNNVSAWIRKVPIFWTPYFFYPTKTDRATGLLTPSVKWSSSRGVIYNQELFLNLGETMDATFGVTYHSLIGLQEEFEFRNAFSQFSRGELSLEHIKENESPSKNRAPEERWKVSYEQNASFPWDVRGTANLNYQSDETYNDDYGAYNQGITRFLDSRVSLTKFWGTTSLTLDGTYEKDFSTIFDERLEHLPRLEFYSGWKDLIGDFNYQIRVKGERLAKAGNATASGIDENGDKWSEIRRLEEDAMRGYFYGELWYEFKEVPWMNIVPWIALDERVWDNQKRQDSDFPDETWATYNELPEPSENDWKAGLYESGDGLHRHLFRAGFDINGPKFYRIFDLLGYKQLTKTKHIIEPKISFEYTPELLGQDRILYFDQEDIMKPETKVTYSLTTRLLMKLKPKNADKKKKKMNQSDDSEDESEDNSSMEGTDADGVDEVSDAEDSVNQSESYDKSGVIREFGYLTISQSFDFYKDAHWEEREVQAGEDERIYHPYSNIKMDLTMNPFSNIYMSGRLEYDPWYDEFSNGYIYGHFRKKEWEFGLRWDFIRNFTDEYYDTHALALEGGMHLNDKWSFSSWIKYDFSKEYAPYVYLDVTYMSQCWGVTVHTYYKNNRDFDPFTRNYRDDNEVKFGISFHLKNVDSIDSDSFGKFWWGDAR